ncbi:CS1-pili formation C-terminal domain-containing protein [Burkholderia vietnamiensis]|uniref:CS1-pili formation C-terminal domain-containing protein n=1 Tax=Burkholderia vietnamiensis TaxID=60552 RepID=UPI0009C07D96|nr:CS1-pili formation C-terminal domain-containing protein [Burkholderia vietnamiensis]MCA8180527.1 CS1-pili formation C-terminal domain-containing protein [Burkholderia vietnamiensis]
MKPLTLAVLLAFAAAGQAFAASGAIAPVRARNAAPGAVEVSELPEGFADALYDTPLAVRVEVDGQYLTDAMVVLDHHRHVTLTQVMDGADSPLPLDTRENYEALLRRGLTLGACSGFDCPMGIVRSAFSMADSKLALFTDHGRAATSSEQHYLAVPKRGSGGALLGHSLSLVTDPRSSASSMNYNLSLTSDLHGWTARSDMQLLYNHYGHFGGYSGGDQWRKYLNDAYLQKEFKGYYVRGGVFAPDDSTDQGNLAPLPFADANTIAGFSVGSSDTLLKTGNRPSMIPLVVNANKAGRAEIYKDGRLIGSYPTQPGINTLPTERLPDGIYSVSVRLYEGNQLVSSLPESIYKPANWNGEDRWRFRVYGGRRFSLWDTSGDDESRDAWVGGGQLGYLLTPKLRGGVSVSYDGIDTPVGLFLDYQLNDHARFYFNPYYSAKRGSGYEVQGTLSAGPASLSFTNRYSERKYSRQVDSLGLNPLPVYTDISRYSSVTGSWQINQHNRLGASFSYDHVHSQRTLDLTFSHDLVTRGGTQLQAFVTVYDRPTSWNGFGAVPSEHGVMIGLSGTLGRESDRVNVSTGAGHSDAGWDPSLNLGYEHAFKDNALQSISLNGNYARSGSSMTASAQVATRSVNGNGYVQYGVNTGDTSLGLDLQSTTAVGGGAVAEGAETAGGAESAVVLDVDSDNDMPAKGLVARLGDGQSIDLHPGRNLIPVSPYEVQHLSFDQTDGRMGGVKFAPTATTVQLYPGGVVHQTIDAMRTITVVGRVVDADGRPQKGIRIQNHAGQAWPENDGVFTLEVSRRRPSITVYRGEHAEATFDLKGKLEQADATGVVVLGDLKCE